ncbi:MAG: hypothetical protein GXP55_17895, partial [Deltaproteobacteria bacterium]|nr:hypothetical protein [Deltaproteobacteria bacterium]
MIKRDERMLLALGLGLAMLAGCGGGGGRPMDSGTRSDTSTPDTGVTLMDAGVDTGSPVDSGMADTSTTTPDGGGGVCPTGACDILSNTGCDAGQACYFSSGAPDAGGPAPVCAPAGTAGDSASCTQ